VTQSCCRQGSGRVLTMAAEHYTCRQPLVPVIDAEDGRWLLTKPLKLMMKPGGHGAIWKLMHDEGESTGGSC